MKKLIALITITLIGLTSSAQLKVDKKDFLFSDTTKYSIFNYYKHCIVEAIFVADQDYPAGVCVNILSGRRVIDTQMVPPIKKGQKNVKIVQFN